MPNIDPIVRGTDYTFRLTVTDATTLSAVAVSDWSLFFAVKKNLTDGNHLLLLTTGVMSISGTGNNIIDIPLTKSQTTLDVGKYWYDVKATIGSSTVALISPQMFDIVWSVTNPGTY